MIEMFELSVYKSENRNPHQTVMSMRCLEIGEIFGYMSALIEACLVNDIAPNGTLFANCYLLTRVDALTQYVQKLGFASATPAPVPMDPTFPPSVPPKNNDFVLFSNLKDDSGTPCNSLSKDDELII